MEIESLTTSSAPSRRGQIALRRPKANSRRLRLDGALRRPRLRSILAAEPEPAIPHEPVRRLPLAAANSAHRAEGASMGSCSLANLFVITAGPASCSTLRKVADATALE